MQCHRSDARSLVRIQGCRRGRIFTVFVDETATFDCSERNRSAILIDSTSSIKLSCVLVFPSQMSSKEIFFDNASGGSLGGGGGVADACTAAMPAEISSAFFFSVMEQIRLPQQHQLRQP